MPQHEAKIPFAIHEYSARIESVALIDFRRRISALTLHCFRAIQAQAEGMNFTSVNALHLLGHSPQAEWAILNDASIKRNEAAMPLREALFETLSHGWCKLGEEPESYLVGKLLTQHGFTCTPYPRRVNSYIVSEALRKGNYVLLRRENGERECGVLSEIQTSVALLDITNKNGDEQVIYYDVLKAASCSAGWNELKISSFSECWFVEEETHGNSRDNTLILTHKELPAALTRKTQRLIQLSNSMAEGTEGILTLKTPTEQENFRLFSYLCSEQNCLKVAVCGEAKRGKSAFINALLGIKGLTAEDYRRRTSVYVHICPAESKTRASEYRVIFNDENQETTIQDADKAKQLISEDTPSIASARILCSSPLLKDLEIEIIDTPGSDSLYRPARLQLQKQTPYWDAVLYIVDSGESPITDSDIKNISEWKERGIAVGIIQTAKDTVSEEDAMDIYRYNKNYLAQTGTSLSLGYHKVDSALRFIAADSGNIVDLQHSNYPVLLYELNTGLRSVCLNHRKLCVQGIKDKLIESIEGDLKTIDAFLKTPTQSDKVTLALKNKKAELKEKATLFCQKLREAFEYDNLENTVYKKICTCKKDEEMASLILFFEPDYQFKCFQEQVRGLLACFCEEAKPDAAANRNAAEKPTQAETDAETRSGLYRLCWDIGSGLFSLAVVVFPIFAPIAWLVPVFPFVSNVHKHRERLSKLMSIKTLKGKQRECRKNCEGMHKTHWADKEKFQIFEARIHQWIDLCIDTEAEKHTQEHHTDIGLKYNQWKDDFAQIQRMPE